MSSPIIRARFTPWQKTAAELALDNAIPLQGERVRETDTGREKTGDGLTHYNDLPYDDEAPRTPKDASVSDAKLTAAVLAARAAGELCARMTVRPKRARRGLMEALIASLITAGVWGKLDGLYVVAAHDEQAAKLNWVGGMQDLTAVNAPIFQIDRGYTGDGATNYLDTNTPADALEQYTANDATLGVYVRTSTSAVNRIDISAGSGAYINPHQSGNVTLRANRTADSVIQISNGGNGSGLFTWSRDASEVRVYRAGALLGAAAVGAGALAASNVRFLLLSTTNFSTRQIQAGIIGKGLNANEHAALNTALVAYLTAIGAN